MRIFIESTLQQSNVHERDIELCNELFIYSLCSGQCFLCHYVIKVIQSIIWSFRIIPNPSHISATVDVMILQLWTAKRKKKFSYVGNIIQNKGSEPPWTIYSMLLLWHHHRPFYYLGKGQSLQFMDKKQHVANSHVHAVYTECRFSYWLCNYVN